MKRLVKMVHKVLVINETFPQAGLNLFKENNITASVLPLKDYYPNAMELIRENIEGHDAIVWNTKIHLTDELVELAGPQLKAVTSMSSGINHIDVSSLSCRGIKFGNTPHALHPTVAEITIGLMLAAARNFKEGSHMIHNGEWKFGVQWLLGHTIEGSTVGVVGLGGIGQAVLHRLKAFNPKRFIYYGRSDKPEAKCLGAERVSLEDLLGASDFVVLSCPLTADTHHLINASTLALMKNNAVLINVARGEVIDHEALYSALKNKQIFAAGLDVTDPEPLPKDHPLIQLPNCYITPHLGSATYNTRNKMAETAAQNIINALQGIPMVTPVN